MPLKETIVVGVDVGGHKKGFHAVALMGNHFVKEHFSDPANLVTWCLDYKATVIAVDAPCGWSKTGLSRLAECELVLSGKKIHCFATPTRERAENHAKGFYDWVFNGEKLYQQLQKHYPLYNGVYCEGPVCIETFPHAVVCALAGHVVSAKPKARNRRKALQDRGYDVSNLPNIDYVDAALCAITAHAFHMGSYKKFGDREEGYIIVPV